NPTEILIKRTEKVRKGGYIDTQKIDVGPFIVRIFSSKSNSPQTVTTLAGEKQIDRSFGLLADHNADIQASTTCTDEIEANGMKFVVKAVYPQRVAGEIVGYQCELERVM